jgi:hypothetical protein
MNANDAGPKFTQKETIDKPGIVGARWWQESIATEVPRRKAITAFIALGGALAGVAAIGLLVSKARSVSSSGGSFFSSEPEYQFQPRSALEMQKEYGWNFGATGDALVFDGQSFVPFDRKALEVIATDLAPASVVYTPYWSPTLFQSPVAMPKSTPPGDPDAATGFKPLKDVLVPISTAAMTTAFGQGKALAEALALQPGKTKDLGIIVDLPGPAAVAFAAGMANRFDPVFLFDNWPHPHGVVPAHLTLAAAVHYQPLFAKAKSEPTRRGKVPPVFVLDRARLSTYIDDATQFDNRYTAKMPTTANLKTMGIARLLYVGPNAIDRFELDDLVDDFVTYATAGAIFRVCPAMAFEALPGSDTFYYGGGGPATSAAFWQHWDQPTGRTPNEVQLYVPKARATPYSSPTPVTPGTTHPRPTGFGTVPVAVAVGTGVILGAKAARSGSWNRTSSTSSSS